MRRARIRAQEGRVELNGYPAGVPEVDFSGLTQVGGVDDEPRGARGRWTTWSSTVTLARTGPTCRRPTSLSLLLTGRTAQAAASRERRDRRRGARRGARRRAAEWRRRDASSSTCRATSRCCSTRATRRSASTSARACARTSRCIYSTRLDGTEQRWVGRVEPRRRAASRFRAHRRPDEGHVGRGDRPRQLQRLPAAARARRSRSGTSVAGSTPCASRASLPLPEEELRKAAKPEDRPPLRPAAHRAGRRQGAREAVEARLARGVGRREAEPAGDASGHVDARAARRRRARRCAVSWIGRRPGREGPRAGARGLAAVRLAGGGRGAVARTARVALQAAGYYEAKVGTSR